MSESKETKTPSSTVQKMLAQIQPMPPKNIIAGPNAGNGTIVSTTGEVIAGGEQQQPTTPPGTVTIVTHADGHPLKFTTIPNPNAEAAPKFALFDAAGVTHAVANHANVAAMICSALKLVNDAQKEISAAPEAQQVEK